ncbi:restriction endonuclease-related protein [Streptomyces seoulensis]
MSSADCATVARLDEAITACCLAAAAFADAALAPQRVTQIAMDCLGLLRAAHPACGTRGLDMAAFRQGLRGPLGALLPGHDEVPDEVSALHLLDSQWKLCEQVHRLCREHLVPLQALEVPWPWARVRAEQQQGRLHETLRQLPPSHYGRARMLCITHPAGEARALRRAWGELWGKVDFFEPVSDWPWAQVAGWWFACPMCRWPMLVETDDHQARVRCTAHAWRGVRYTLDLSRADGTAVPWLRLAGRPSSRKPWSSQPVVGQPASSDHLAFQEGAWHFTTVAGLVEKELRDSVHKEVPEADCEMWPADPYPDAYDMRVSVQTPHGERVFRVDVKDWMDAAALARSLTSKPLPEKFICVVVPDHQESQLPTLNERLPATHYRAFTVSRFIQRVRDAVQGDA